MKNFTGIQIQIYDLQRSGLVLLAHFWLGYNQKVNV